MNLAVQLAEDDSASCRVLDFSRLEQLGTNIDHPGKRSLMAPSLCDLVGVVDTVLQRQNDRAVADQGRQFVGGRLRVVGFDAEEHKIDDSDLAEIVGEQSITDVQVALRTFERQSLPAQRRQVRTTRDECDIIGYCG